MEYRAHVGDAQPAAVDGVRLNVRAGVTLAVRPRRLRGGGAIRISGRLLAAPATGIGKIVTLQARERGHWRDFENARTHRGGRFSATYRFSRSARGTFPIRAVVRADAGYPYATGRSRTVRVRVRGTLTLVVPSERGDAAAGDGDADMESLIGCPSRCSAAARC